MHAVRIPHVRASRLTLLLAAAFAFAVGLLIAYAVAKGSHPVAPITPFTPRAG